MFPAYFISPSASQTLWQVIIAAFISNVTTLIQGEGVHLPTIDACIDLIQATAAQALPEIALVEVVLPDIFLYSYLIPISTAPQGEEVDETPSQVTGKELWHEWVKTSTDDARNRVVDVIKDRLRELVANTSIQSMYVISFIKIITYIERSSEGLKISSF